MVTWDKLKAHQGNIIEEEEEDEEEEEIVFLLCCARARALVLSVGPYFSHSLRLKFFFYLYLTKTKEKSFSKLFSGCAVIAVFGLLF